MKEKWTALKSLAELFEFQRGRAVYTEEKRYNAPIEETFVDAYVALFSNNEGIAVVTFGEHYYGEDTIEPAYTLWYKIEVEPE